MPRRSLRDQVKEQGEKVKRQQEKSEAARKHGAEAVAHSQSLRKEVDKLSRSVSQAMQRAAGKN